MARKKAIPDNLIIQAGLYVRVSSREQAEEGYSLAAQENTLRQYCRMMGWQLAGVYKDEGISGKNTHRAGLQQLLVAAQKGSISKVITLKLDRLSRNSKDLLNLTDDLEKMGVSICYVKDQIDTSTAAGKMMRTIMSAMAQFESDIAKERTLSVKEELARQGKFAGGNSSYGYDYNKEHQKFVVKENEATIVKKIFSKYIAGESLYKIAKSFNDANIKTKKGCKWQVVQVHNILRNRFYIGLLDWQGLVSKGQHDAIISERQFNKVQRLLLKS